MDVDVYTAAVLRSEDLLLPLTGAPRAPWLARSLDGSRPFLPDLDRQVQAAAGVG